MRGGWNQNARTASSALKRGPRSPQATHECLAMTGKRVLAKFSGLLYPPPNRSGRAIPGAGVGLALRTSNKTSGFACWPDLDWRHPPCSPIERPTGTQEPFTRIMSQFIVLPVVRGLAWFDIGWHEGEQRRRPCARRRDEFPRAVLLSQMSCPVELSASKLKATVRPLAWLLRCGSKRRQIRALLILSSVSPARRKC